MDIAALIISIISIIVSAFGYFHSKKINDINLEAGLSSDSIKSFLTTQLPNARSEMCYTDGKLSNIDQMQEVLNKIVKKLRFISYTDQKFYTRFKDACQDLEDFIVSREGKFFDVDEQAELTKQINTKIKGLYKLLNKKYKNG